MNEKNPLLKIRFDGEAVGPGKIPVAHLLRFLTNMEKALQRTGRVLTGEAESVRVAVAGGTVELEITALDGLTRRIPALQSVRLVRGERLRVGLVPASAVAYYKTNWMCHKVEIGRFLRNCLNLV